MNPLVYMCTHTHNTHAHVHTCTYTHFFLQLSPLRGPESRNIPKVGSTCCKRIWVLNIVSTKRNQEKQLSAGLRQWKYTEAAKEGELKERGD